MFDLTNLLATRIPRLGAPFFPDMLWRLPSHRTDERVAYLTFDDGPTGVMTGELLDMLNRYDAKATFFLLGMQAQRYPGLVRTIDAAGHVVGNHTFTHPDAWRVSAPVVLRELDRTAVLLQDQLGQAVHWMRPPFGRFTGSMRAWCQVRRQRMTMWDVMPGDWLDGTDAHRVAARILHLIRPGSIVVLHDNPRAYATTMAALDVVLARLTAEGWRFPALPQRPGLEGTKRAA